MPHSEATIHIDRAPEEVWAYLEQTENIPVWNGAIVSAEADGPPAVGARTRGLIKFLGRKMDYVNEITEMDAPKRYAFRSVEAPFPFRGGTELEPDGDGTMVRNFLETDDLGGFFGKIGDAMATKMYTRQMRTDLETLKEILEG